MLDVPPRGAAEVDLSDQTFRRIQRAGYGQQEPIESRVDDAGRIILENFGIVFRIQPGAARKLRKTA